MLNKNIAVYLWLTNNWYLAFVFDFQPNPLTLWKCNKIFVTLILLYPLQHTPNRQTLIARNKESFNLLSDTKMVMSYGYEGIRSTNVRTDDPQLPQVTGGVEK